MGQELGKGSAEQFSYGGGLSSGCHKISIGGTTLQGYMRLENPLSKWLTHLASKSVLAPGQEPQLLSTWASNGMVTGSTTERDPRDQGRDQALQITHCHFCQEGPALTQCRKKKYKSMKTRRQWRPSRTLAPRESERWTIRHCGCSRCNWWPTHIYPTSNWARSSEDWLLPGAALKKWLIGISI